jgi:hypothetical protein
MMDFCLSERLSFSTTTSWSWFTSWVAAWPSFIKSYYKKSFAFFLVGFNFPFWKVSKLVKLPSPQLLVCRKSHSHMQWIFHQLSQLVLPRKVLKTSRKARTFLFCADWLECPILSFPNCGLIYVHKGFLVFRGWGSWGDGTWLILAKSFTFLVELGFWTQGFVLAKQVLESHLQSIMLWLLVILLVISLPSR